MTNWRARVNLTHLFTKDEDFEAVQKSMNEIADVIEASHYFNEFDTTMFREIPHGDSFFGPVDYANKLINWLYDYADEHKIWIE